MQSGINCGGLLGSLTASIPPAAQDAALMACPRSSTATESPRCCNSRASDNPMMPAPAMTTSTTPAPFIASFQFLPASGQDCSRESDLPSAGDNHFADVVFRQKEPAGAHFLEECLDLAVLIVSQHRVVGSLLSLHSIAIHHVVAAKHGLRTGHFGMEKRQSLTVFTHHNFQSPQNSIRQGSRNVVER